MNWPNLDNRFDIVYDAKNLWTWPMFIEVFMVGAWNIWKERNNMLFNRITPSLSSWKARFKCDFQLLIYRTKPELQLLLIILYLPCYPFYLLVAVNYI
jgi:hypothetical protein